MLNPEALEKQAQELPDSETVVSFLREAVLQAAEHDSEFSTEHWPGACQIIINLARHDLKAARELLGELSEQEEERRKKESPEQDIPSSYQRSISKLRRELKSILVCEAIRKASVEEIDAQITLFALRNERPKDLECDELVLAVLKQDPERACRLACEWQASTGVTNALIPICRQACPDRLLKLILQNYGARAKWLEDWIVDLLPNLDTEAASWLIHLLRLLRENVRTSLVYRETDLLILEAIPTSTGYA
ncbi:MAG: hypothetical protein QM758_23695 [Armatimonas sp.]